MNKFVGLLVLYGFRFSLLLCSLVRGFAVMSLSISSDELYSLDYVVCLFSIVNVAQLLFSVGVSYYGVEKSDELYWVSYLYS